MSVKLRTKKLQDGKESLYLDIYYKGKRQYEFLGLSYKKNDPNKKNIKELAEKRRSQKELEIFSNAHNLPNYYNGKEDFLKYYESKCVDAAYKSSYKLLKEYSKNKLTNDKLPFNKVDEKFCENYILWMKERGLKNNTAWVNIYKLKAVLNKAVKEKIIPFNPSKYVSIKLEETEKIFLTFDEVNKMYNTEIKNKEIWRSFLFSCYTGLRLSDIKALTWGQIREGKLYFKQKKTKGIEYLPLNEMALKILLTGKSNEDIEKLNETVFNFKNGKSEKIGEQLRKWAKESKVNKYITFHTARHTFATLSLTYGVDLFTVSKLLGHRSINTTQIYAQIVNEKLNEAVSKLPTLKEEKQKK
ncbi:MAG: site-specific integrase [Ignavibacterium sp.]|nr:site-specific integrase [Ignavibacterium sp.]